MSYLGVKSKIALTIDGIVSTAYEFNCCKEFFNTMVLWNENLIVWYNKKTCKEIKKIEGCTDITCDNDVFIVTKNGLKGVYSSNGKNLLPIKYTDITAYEKCIEVVLDDAKGAYSYDGKCILPARYMHLIYLDDGITASFDESGEFYGLYPYDGKGTIIANKYSYCNHNDKVMLYLDEEKKNYVLFSHDGKEIASVESYFMLFLDNAIKIERNGKKGLVSYTGEEILPPEYDYISEIKETNKRYYVIEKDNKVGIASCETGITIPPEFDKMIELFEHAVLLRMGRKLYLYSYDGIKLVSHGYERIVSIPEAPGVFKLMSSKPTMLYIAPLNKYIPDTSVGFNESNGNYYYLDNVSGEWIKA